MSKVKERVKEELFRPIEEMGYELVDVEYRKEGPQQVLRLFIDRPQGIQIEDCVNVNKLCDSILDQKELISTTYTLEVSSPGIFRPLTEPKHFERAVGQRIGVWLYRSLEGMKKAKGTLIEISEQGIRLKLEEGGKELHIPYELISKSNLEPELEF
ncbi:ribosome maturation factor RimP [Deltaproteobacteria bacterium TL4]